MPASARSGRRRAQARRGGVPRPDSAERVATAPKALLAREVPIADAAPAGVRVGAVAATLRSTMSDGSPPPLPENGPATEVMRPRSARSAAAARRVGYLVAILVNVVLRYLANGVPHWNVPFITNDWPDVLWAINLSLGAAIAANLIFLVFDPRWFRRSAQIVLNALSIVATRALYQVFPFDLGRASYEQAARWALLALIVALAIATIIEFLGLILGRDR